MGKMFQTLKNAWNIPDLRKRIFITVMLLLVFRLGSFIPVPGLNPDALRELINAGGSLFGFIDILTGGAFKQATIFAMSITPYINAQIIMQLLTIVIPKLEMLQREGEEGRKLIAQYVRYGTVLLAFLQATALYFGLGSASIVGGYSVLSYFVITLTFTAGTAFLMWLGEKITEHGIGNGISLLIFGGIISRGPSGFQALIAAFINLKTTNGIITAIVGAAAIILVFLAIIAGVVYVQEAERRIPVQYAKRVVGRKIYGGQSSHIPMKVNMAGVIPIIFAMSIMMFPSTIIGFTGASSDRGIVKFFTSWPEKISFSITAALLVVVFTFFYTVVQFNPVELSNNIKKNGGFIPGIRAGKSTSDYISGVLNRITWFGAIFLAIIQVFPSIIGRLTSIRGVWFAGPGVLIMVNVALEMVKQMESQMLMRHYKGFLD